MKFNYSFFALFALLFAYVSCASNNPNSNTPSDPKSPSKEDGNDSLDVMKVIQKLREHLEKDSSNIEKGQYETLYSDIKSKLETNREEILKQANLDKYFSTGGSDFVAGIILIATGIALAFMGRRIFKLFLTLSGAVVGACSAFLLLVFIEKLFHPKEPAPGYLLWVACSIGAIFGAYLFNAVWKWGIYALSAFGGVCVGICAFSMIPKTYTESIPPRNIFIAICGFLGGLAAHFMDELIVITSSSLLGAFSIFFGIDFLHPVGFRAHVVGIVNESKFNEMDAVISALGENNILYCSLGVLFVTVSGVYVQYRLQPRSYDRD